MADCALYREIQWDDITDQHKPVKICCARDLTSSPSVQTTQQAGQSISHHEAPLVIDVGAGVTGNQCMYAAATTSFVYNTYESLVDQKKDGLISHDLFEKHMKTMDSILKLVPTQPRDAFIIAMQKFQNRKQHD